MHNSARFHRIPGVYPSSTPIFSIQKSVSHTLTHNHPVHLWRLPIPSPQDFPNPHLSLRLSIHNLPGQHIPKPRKGLALALQELVVALDCFD